MKDLGYTYDENKRTYYTDGHERQDVVEDRDNRFLKEYFNYEIRCHRWVQLSRKDAEDLHTKHKDFPINSCHEFTCTINDKEVPYCEFHYDSHHSLQFK